MNTCIVFKFILAKLVLMTEAHLASLVNDSDIASKNALVTLCFLNVLVNFISMNYRFKTVLQ